MMKQYFILLGFLLLTFFSLQTVKAATIPKEAESYFTTNDIILDIVFPTIDKKVIKEYSDDTINWNFKRIVGINYNNNHSYDVDARIEITPHLSNERDINVNVKGQFTSSNQLFP